MVNEFFAILWMEIEKGLELDSNPLIFSCFIVVSLWLLFLFHSDVPVIISVFTKNVCFQLIRPTRNFLDTYRLRTAPSLAIISLDTLSVINDFVRII